MQRGESGCVLLRPSPCPFVSSCSTPDRSKVGSRTQLRLENVTSLHRGARPGDAGKAPCELHRGRHHEQRLRPQNQLASGSEYHDQERSLPGKQTAYPPGDGPRRGGSGRLQKPHRRPPEATPTWRWSSPSLLVNSKGTDNGTGAFSARCKAATAPDRGARLGTATRCRAACRVGTAE